MDHLGRLYELKERVTEAQRAVLEEMARAFPKGQRITWKHGGLYPQAGQVLWVSTTHEYLVARNERTGKAVEVYLSADPRPTES
jgi:hypothetical protein